MNINPIFDIIERGDVVELQRMVASRAPLSDVYDDRGFTPLQMAADVGQLECVKALLDAQVPVDQISPYRPDSPLMRASYEGHVEVAQLLLSRGADVNFNGPYDESPLYKTVLMGQGRAAAVAKLLLNEGAKIHSHMVRSAVSKPALIRVFLENGLSVNYKTDQGETLYTLALRAKSVCLTRLLKAKGADVYAGRDLPLHAAIQKGTEEVKRILQQSGMEIDKQDLCGTTPLLAAILAKQEDSASLLMKAGANPNLGNDKKLTPLKAAIYLGLEGATRKLIEHKADIHASAKTGGWNALWVAAFAGDLKLFEELLKRGVDYKTLDEQGTSLLAMIKTYRPKHKKALIQLLKAHAKDFEEMYRYAKQFKAQKRLGLVSHEANETTIQGVKVKSEYGRPEYAAKIYAKAIYKFSQEFATLDRGIAQELSQALYFAADQQSHTAEQTFTRIRSGQLTIILTGWLVHASAWGAYKERVILSNTGAVGMFPPAVAMILGSPTIEPLQIHHYNPDGLNVEKIERLREGMDEVWADRESYADLMYSELPEKLQYTQTPEDIELSKKADIKKQTINNCGGAALEAFVKGFLTLRGQSHVFKSLMEYIKTKPVHSGS